ncbi:MAG TPA: cytochrome P450 [Polyangiaceae bacterium]|nr:cytochrome P450 [Polyangiaceae bacterium]
MSLAPSPPAEPLFGHARALSRDPLGTLVGWMHTYGSVVRFRVGSREAHVVFGPEEVRQVLTDPEGLYGKDTHGYRTLRLFVGNGLLTSEPPLWTRQRRILKPAFHGKSIASYVKVMGEVAEASVAEMAERGRVRLDEVAMRATLAIVGRALFGADLGAQAPRIAEAITTLQVAANRRIAAPFEIPFVVPTPEHLRIRAARAALETLFEALLRARRARPGVPHDAPRDVLDVLLEARDEAGRPLPEAQIQDELVTLLIAGHESTANALVWAVVLLSRYPDEVRLLREELDALPPGHARHEAATRAPRLRAVVDETLRLYPPAWSFGRAPRRDTTVGGFAVPRGRLVMLAPFATHRDPHHFPNPEAFVPDRFLGAEPPPFAYFPFGGGARTCIGHTFARLEARILLAAWVGELELSTELSPEPSPLVTLRPRGAVHAHAKRRTRAT